MTDQFNEVLFDGNEGEAQAHEAEKVKGGNKKPKAKAVAAEPAVALPPVFNIMGELQSLLTAKKNLEAENAKLLALLEEVSSVNSLVAVVAVKVNRVVKGVK